MLAADEGEFFLGLLLIIGRLEAVFETARSCLSCTISSASRVSRLLDRFDYAREFRIPSLFHEPRLEDR